MPKHFFEELLKKEYNIDKEICNIDDLFYKECRSNSIDYQIKKNFMSWTDRNNFITYLQMKEETGINKIIKQARNKNNVFIEDFIFYLEFVINILSSNISFDDDKYKFYIFENIKNILDSINFTSKHVDKHYIIVPKNFETEKAAEIVSDSDKNIAEKIYLYNHRDLQGNTFEKAIILSRLYMYYEKIEEKLKKNNFSNLSKKIGELSNSLNVRHAPKDKAEIILKNVSPEILEDWYDKLFELYIMAIIFSNYLDIKVDVEEIKSKINL